MGRVREALPLLRPVSAIRVCRRQPPLGRLPLGAVLADVLAVPRGLRRRRQAGDGRAGPGVRHAPVGDGAARAARCRHLGAERLGGQQLHGRGQEGVLRRRPVSAAGATAGAVRHGL